MRGNVKQYDSEREGQIAFFDDYKTRIESIKNLELEDILSNHSDGVINGNILEFKLDKSSFGNNYSKVLSQSIKYLSTMRLTGRKVPRNILIIVLNDAKVFQYDSSTYLNEIEHVYSGPSSVGAIAFKEIPSATTIYDLTKDIDKERLIKTLNTNEYTKIHIDANCVLGWANIYYKTNPTSTKDDFLGKFYKSTKVTAGEIRKPATFKDCIYPYKKETNVEFDRIMDALNPTLLKKELGAFYTPKAYCKKATELVTKAIKLVPKGNDYIILDRCAGTGNLEEVLTDEQLKHTIVSTYELHEYLVLLEKLGTKVKYIIPPTPNEAATSTRGGLIQSSNALTEDYINNETIKKYIDNPKITVIMLENPPYHDTSASDFLEGSRQKITDRKGEFVTQQMKNNLEHIREKRASTREISNLFIWSAFKYYLRQPTDSYIVLSPVKYFKSIGLVNKTFKEGFLFNRKYFHAKQLSESAISCVWWQNADKEQETFVLSAFNYVDKRGLKQEDDEIVYEKDIEIKKVYETYSVFNDSRKFDNDVETNFVCQTNGYPDKYNRKTGRKPLYNKNIIAYFKATSFNLDGNSRSIVRANYKAGIEQSYGFHLRFDNYLVKLPLFCAKLYPKENWYEKDVYFTTADGGTKYTEDDDFLKSCFIYTCLSPQNHCVSFIGFDGRDYKNELCFDNRTIATKQLKKFTLDEREKHLFKLWRKLLKVAKQKDEYKTLVQQMPNLKLGTYQIDKEINIVEEFTVNKETIKQPKYGDANDVNDVMINLKSALKDYYRSHIQDKLFTYELLK
ncbi:MAG: hypothetical protein LBL41_03475 [Bifidobacteriaceae bacterium]|jgi:hypothetical protein|nr:hypothetical protein [Bifidobacteriaceae bacterium]